VDYIHLGKSGLRVSKFVFGTVTFSGTHGFEALGSTVGNEARRQIEIALDAGVNAFDTANLYSYGDSESVLGEALSGRRNEVLIFTKAGFPLSKAPNDGGASRIHLIDQVEKSLRRLRTDYLDLYFVHLWDGATPIEETVETMSSLVKAGKTRYWGVSNYSGWALAKTVLTARALGLGPPISQQIYYTAEAREAEYELLPAGQELGVTSMIWSPLGQGVLTGKVYRGQKAPAGSRQGTEGWKEPWVMSEERLYRVVDGLKEVAAEHNATIAQIALAWIKDRPGVGPVVLGARNEQQLRENLAAVSIKLTQQQHDRIELVARPAPIYPYWHRAMHATARATPSEAEYLRLHRKTLGYD
jgi:aryl-alcohol dehydrogenase-like predicted oxidoreductase